MNTNTSLNESSYDTIMENIAKWQSTTNPLAPLTDEQLDLVYQMEDIVNEEYYKKSDIVLIDNNKKVESQEMPLIDSNWSFFSWFGELENDMRKEKLQEHNKHFLNINEQGKNVTNLFNFACESTSYLESLQKTHQEALNKTDYLHDLSEELMKQQMILKEKCDMLNKELKYFRSISNSYFTEKNYNSKEFTQYLDEILDNILNLSIKTNYKEARIYKMRNESILLSHLGNVYRFFTNIIAEASRYILDPEKSSDTDVNLNADSAFSFYYGKFQSAAHKINILTNYLEEKSENNEHFQSCLNDCHKVYISHRMPILMEAAAKALYEIKDKHKTDYSILFRSSGLFMMKVCQDETNCFNYFFKKMSPQFDNYLSSLCQNLYDILRPCLIGINHIEILSELCSILRKEMLNDRVMSNISLEKYIDTINQLLEDVEERLVFRSNVFFQHDLIGYKPSSGDLAYPEKLIQMENIAAELQEGNSDVYMGDTSSIGYLRSYTGNSAADLHGMWYPTVKRTLVFLSRLYFCLDRDTFQGLAQEALVICARTVDEAAIQISSKKSKIDGLLFQIKHLLIVREQITPFQVDFTVKEVSLDFSNVQKAATDLINRRDKIFTFSSNNALLEFLLEGTPKVKEYLIDSRKEIDKQLKHSCEAFITFSTEFLVGSLLNLVSSAYQFEQSNKSIENNVDKIPLLRDQSFGNPENISKLIVEAQKNIKTKIPHIQRSMQLYLANRETEFILFRLIKNNIINAFISVGQMLVHFQYSSDDQLLVACPSAIQVNVLISSVSLTLEDRKSVV